jgi:alpha-beta hydrolase superfamily lysophospholipase
MNTAYFYEQSDPDLNRHFSRRWTEPGHLTSPSALDRQADFLLFHGRTAQAERLAHAAEMLRNGGAR